MARSSRSPSARFGSMFGLLCWSVITLDVDSQQYKCHDKCKTCHLFDYNLEWHCVECFPGYELWVDGCFLPCPTGQYRNGYQCEACYEHCTECVGPMRHECTQCEAGYHFDTRNVCVKDCEAFQYSSTDGLSCGPCNSLCLRCISEYRISCTECYEGYILRIIDNNTASGECMAACPDGFYRDSPADTTRCIQCAEYCLRCESRDRCFECEEGAELVYGVCRSTNTEVEGESLDFQTFLNSGAGIIWDTSNAPNWTILTSLARRRLEEEEQAQGAEVRSGEDDSIPVDEEL